MSKRPVFDVGDVVAGQVDVTTQRRIAEIDGVDSLNVIATQVSTNHVQCHQCVLGPGTID